MAGLALFHILFSHSPPFAVSRHPLLHSSLSLVLSEMLRGKDQLLQAFIFFPCPLHSSHVFLNFLW